MYNVKKNCKDLFALRAIALLLVYENKQCERSMNQVINIIKVLSGAKMLLFSHMF